MLAKALQGAAKSAVAAYIEDVFSTYLYTGNGSAAQTITNNVDLTTYGGLVWTKSRSNAISNILTDTVRGADKSVFSDLTIAQQTGQTYIGSFLSNGFTVGSTANGNTYTYASWTFRKQAKFFDVVTYTGNGTTQNIAHSLGSTPGCIMVKRTDAAGEWYVYHRSLTTPASNYLFLNRTDATTTSTAVWNNTAPTSTQFSVGTTSATNGSGLTYIAYIFAHDAGGFGASGTDNVISCGSFTADGSGNVTVSLGYEPQWILYKRTNSTGNWFILDNMRGWVNGNNDQRLYANLSNAEDSGDAGHPNSNGFNLASLGASGQYIYIAIRRGPMRTPTSGTSVFSPLTRTGTANPLNITGAGFAPDLFVSLRRTSATYSHHFTDRLRGAGAGSLFPMLTDAENTTVNAVTAFGMDGISFGTSPVQSQNAGTTYVYNFFRRAPGFFDVVCYTGNGVTNRTVTHNLTVAPELLFVKARSNVQNWSALCTLSGGLQGRLNTTAALSAPSAAVWGNGTSYVAPTSTVFTVGTDIETNASTWTYVAYLFATVAGVSKVGSYTGNGSNQTINCGFTAGARFVLIKRTNSTGDWYVWDTARGIVSGNDPHLSLNTTVAEVTTDDTIDPDNSGFIVNQVAATNVNVNAATYIFLAIA